MASFSCGAIVCRMATVSSSSCSRSTGRFTTDSRRDFMYCSPAEGPMRRRIPRWIVPFVLAVTGIIYFAIVRATDRASKQFLDLDAALAEEKEHGWELAVPPRRSGPYQALPGGPVLGLVPGQGLTCRIRGKNGQVVEEVQLQGSAAFGRSVVCLETPDGQRTMAVL